MIHPCGDANVLRGDQDSTNLQNASSFDTFGITAGVDYRLRDNWIMGVAFGLTDTRTKAALNRGEIDAQGYNLTLYSSFFP